ncbi:MULTISPECIES: hypothetical protein [unclassified Clostridium]|uniref:hypothetical protein n=1 Tax=unclassified Clostridium TaxID=2614128 RepID=UPI002079C614|nr:MULTISPECIES: hypothetical protein [unclassified Clostridium]
MARQVVCKICKNKLSKDDAYCVETKSKDEKLKRSYYCDSIEYENYIFEKEQIKTRKDNVFKVVNEILGYECVSYNVISKELNPILKVYNYEQILYCFKLNKDSIKNYMNLKNIDKEYNKIRYIFTVISSTIADTSKELEIEKDINKIKEQKINNVIENDINTNEEYVYKKQSVTDFSSFF